MKTKITIIFMIINILSFSQTNYTWVKVFDEQFIDNSNNWYLTNDEERKSEIVGGKLIDKFNFDKNYAQSNTIQVNFNEYNDYKINFAIANSATKKNKIYGFVWGYKNWDNFNCISFYKDNLGDTYFKIESVFGKNKVIHQDWTRCLTGFKDDNAFNKITIEKKSSKWEFTFNDYYYGKFAECPSEIWSSKKCGVLIGSGSNVILDYLTIEEKREIKTSIQQPITEVIETIEEKNDNPSSGSGIILTKNGYIATNHHVIENAKHIEVDIFVGGVKKTYLADIVRSDVTNDLALIKIRNKNFVSTDLKYGIKAHDVKVGERVFSLGYPMIDLQGNEIKLTDGLISSKSGYQNDPTTYQISAPIQPGNSGGPLFDMNGNLIGITSSGLNTSTGAQNVNYAIKISYLLNFLDVESNITSLPSQSFLIGKPLTEIVSKLSSVVVLIRVNDKTISEYETEAYSEDKPSKRIDSKISEEAETNLQNFDINISQIGYIANRYKKFKYNIKTKQFVVIEDKQILSYICLTNNGLYLKKEANDWLYFDFENWTVKENGDIYANETNNHIYVNKERSKITFYTLKYDIKHEYIILRQDDQLVFENLPR
jgi:hypothetical protein